MKFNKFNLIISGLFVFGFVLIMLNFISSWLNLLAMILFVVASIMLTISFYFSCKRKNAILSSEQEEIIMELAVEDGMETYIPKEKKKGKFKKFVENARIFSPCILSVCLSVALISLLVLTITKLL